MIVAPRELRCLHEHSAPRPNGTCVEVYVTACQFQIELGEDEK